jgi:hypothetical protein
MSKDSNIMGFHSIKNKPHFNTFNLDRRNLFTAKIGQLLPIFCEEVMPGDEIKINMQHFSRSMPVQTAAFTRLKENIQFFFVPYTALWSFYRDAIKNIPTNQSGQPNTMRADSASSSVSLSTELPNFSSGAIYKWFNYVAAKFKDANVNNVGGSHSLRVSESARLLQSLGYGNFTSISKLYRDNEEKPTKLMLDGAAISGVNVPSTPVGVRVSPFRLLAYHKIANDFYRYQKWEEYCAPSCNVDYLPQNVPNMDNFLDSKAFDSWTSEENTINSYLFDMEYSRLPLDRFNGGLPRAQFGDESVVNLNGSSSFDVNKTSIKSPINPAGLFVIDGPNLSVSGHSGELKTGSPLLSGGVASTDFVNIDVPNKSGTSFEATSLSGNIRDGFGKILTDVSISQNSSSELSVIALRRATALQRYKEIQECNDSDFCSQIEAHFGVRPNSHGTKSKFLGGYSAVFDINPQVNQNLTGDNVATIQAAPTASGNGSCRFKVADDYGLVIGIYRITPQLDYADVGLDCRNLMVDAADYPIPELDSIGMDTLKINSLVVKDYPVNGNVDLGGVNTSYAYAPRYLDFKLSFDRFSGAFLSSLRTWVTGQQMDLLQKAAASAPLGGSVGGFLYHLLYCPPRLTENVFVNNAYDGIDNDQFMIGSFIGCSVKRKLSVYGLPYSN